MARKKGGLLFGIIMGTLMGVIFAPGKGKVLRQKILKEINEGGLGTKALGSDIKMMGRDIVDVAQDVYENPRVQGGVKSGRKNLKQMFGEIGKKVGKKFSEVKSRK